MGGYQVELSNARVDVVGAWHDPAEYAFAYGWSPAVFEDVSIAAITEKMLVEAVTDVASGGAPVRFTTRTWYAGIRLRCCWTPRTGRSCWWWAAGDTEPSPGCCSARSASTAYSTRRARW